MSGKESILAPRSLNIKHVALVQYRHSCPCFDYKQKQSEKETAHTHTQKRPRRPMQMYVNGVKFASIMGIINIIFVCLFGRSSENYTQKNTNKNRQNKKKKPKKIITQKLH